MLSPEERAARQAAREAKKLENREKWSRHPLNANVAHAERQSATKAIPAELSPAFKGSNALKRLRLIMASPDVSLSRRLRAAQHILRFELAPGGAIGLEPHEIASDAYQFFSRVAESPEASDAHRQEALEAMAVVEAERAIRSDPGAAVERRNLAIALINAARRMALVASGTWHSACISGVSWSITAADDVEVPTATQSNGNGIAAALEHAQSLPPGELDRRRQARRAALLAVRAVNRPDAWERWLTADAEMPVASSI